MLINAKFPTDFKLISTALGQRAAAITSLSDVKTRGGGSREQWTDLWPTEDIGYN